jgi:hypothetical protein
LDRNGERIRIDDVYPLGRFGRSRKLRARCSERHEASLVDRRQTPLGYGFEKRLNNVDLETLSLKTFIVGYRNLELCMLIHFRSIAMQEVFVY